MESIADDRLKLMFTCCQPSLSLEAQVALTLHTLGGLSTQAAADTYQRAIELCSNNAERNYLQHRLNEMFK
jgi:RNA polymerase sigma-70 factor (ECF subfamily)